MTAALHAAIERLDALVEARTGSLVFARRASPPDLLPDAFGDELLALYQRWEPADPTVIWFPASEMRFLALDEALELREELTELHAELAEDIDAEELDHSGDVRDDLYSPKRFPVAMSEIAQCYLMVDSEPGETGTRYQLIANPDAISFARVAGGLAELLGRWGDLLEDGALALELEEGGERWLPVVRDVDAVEASGFAWLVRGA